MKEQEYLGNQNHQEVKVGGQGVAGGVDVHGCEGGTTHEVAAAAAVAGAGELDGHGCGKDGGLGEEQDLYSNPQGRDDYGDPAELETVLNWRLWALQKTGIGLQQACN